MEVQIGYYTYCGTSCEWGSWGIESWEMARRCGTKRNLAHVGLTSNNRMLSKTRDYLDHFARFKRKENVEAVERLLSAHKELAKFERAQLGSSFPSNEMETA